VLYSKCCKSAKIPLYHVGQYRCGPAVQRAAAARPAPAARARPPPSVDSARFVRAAPARARQAARTAALRRDRRDCATVSRRTTRSENTVRSLRSRNRSRSWSSNSS
jgi:hypothetical protein